MAAKLDTYERDKAAQIVALFSCLIHEWLTGNIHEAEDTTRRLYSMGVQVKLRPCRVGEGKP